MNEEKIKNEFLKFEKALLDVIYNYHEKLPPTLVCVQLIELAKLHAIAFCDENEEFLLHELKKCVEHDFSGVYRRIVESREIMQNS